MNTGIESALALLERVYSNCRVSLFLRVNGRIKSDASTHETVPSSPTGQRTESNVQARILNMLAIQEPLNTHLSTSAKAVYSLPIVDRLMSDSSSRLF